MPDHRRALQGSARWTVAPTRKALRFEAVRSALSVASGACLLAASALVACGAFSADSDDRSPAAPAGDGSVSDGSSGSDAPATTDGDVDAMTNLDAGSDGAKKPSCGGGLHWVCDDFDESTKLSMQWAPIVSLGAVISIDTQTGAPSPPNVLSSTITGTANRAQVESSEALPKVGSVRCELDFLHSAAGTGPASGETQFVRLAMTGMNGDLALELRARSDGAAWYFRVTSPASGTPALATPFTSAAGTWSHLVLDIGGAGGALSAKVDGVERLVGDSFPGTDTIVAAGSVKVDVGASALPGPAVAQAQFDNVVCDVLP